MRLRIFVAAAFATFTVTALVSANEIRKTALGLGVGTGIGMYLLERPRTQKHALANVFVYSK